jgi:hypothetical protein
VPNALEPEPAPALQDVPPGAARILACAESEEQQLEDITAYRRWCTANGLELVTMSAKGWLRQGRAEPTPYAGVAQTSPEGYGVLANT